MYAREDPVATRSIGEIFVQQIARAALHYRQHTIGQGDVRHIHRSQGRLDGTGGAPHDGVTPISPVAIGAVATLPGFDPPLVPQSL